MAGQKRSKAGEIMARALAPSSDATSCTKRGRTQPHPELWQWDRNEAEVWFGFPEPGQTPAALQDYGQVLAHGFDTLETTWSVGIPDDLALKLDAAKAQAAELDTPALVTLGGQDYQVSPRGAMGGIRWWLASDQWEVKIRLGNKWNVSIRHRSQALWELTADEAHAASIRWLADVFRVPRCATTGDLRPMDEWQRVTDGHWAVDVESSAYTAGADTDLVKSVVAHSRVKVTPEDPFSDESIAHMSDAELGARCRAVAAGDRGKLSWWARGGRVETLTIGKGRPLTIQVYNKGVEISEASGKTWMYDLWERSGWQRPTEVDPDTGEVKDVRPKDVHRVEIRMRSTWMAERGVHTWEDLQANRDRLVAEALTTRRLTVPSETDSNRGRWPPHPMWQIVAWVSGHVEDLAPLGRRIVEAAQAKFKGLIQQGVGVLRAAAVLANGAWDGDYFDRLLRDEDSPVHRTLAEDKGHDGKCGKLVARYLLTPGHVVPWSGDHGDLRGGRRRMADLDDPKEGETRLAFRLRTLKSDVRACREASYKDAAKAFGDWLPVR